MGDLISREEVKEILRTEWVKLFPVELDPYLSLAMEKIENIPSAEKRGKWKPIDVYEVVVACSECKQKFTYEHNYCPNCGAKMEVSE